MKATIFLIFKPCFGVMSFCETGQYLLSDIFIIRESVEIFVRFENNYTYISYVIQFFD